METTAKRLITLLKGLLDFGWYLNFLLIALAFFFLGRELLFNNYVEVSCDVKLPRQELNTGLKPIGNLAKEARLSTIEGSLHFEMKNTVYSQVSSFLLFVVIEFLIMATLYNLRKLFGNLKKDKHFLPENVLALKRVALFVALAYPLKWVIYMLTQQILNTHFDERYSVKTGANFYILIIAATIYIMAAIFNRGLELRKENEEFV